MFAGSSNAVEQCYYQLNSRGDGVGNCGYSNGAFVACSGGDRLCGQLHCDSGTFQGQVSIGVYIYTADVIVNGVSKDCLTFSPITTPTDLIHPGLVQNGTKCGDQMVF